MYPGLSPGKFKQQQSFTLAYKIYLHSPTRFIYNYLDVELLDEQ